MSNIAQETGLVSKERPNEKATNRKQFQKSDRNIDDLSLNLCLYWINYVLILTLTDPRALNLTLTDPHDDVAHLIQYLCRSFFLSLF